MSLTLTVIVSSSPYFSLHVDFRRGDFLLALLLVEKVPGALQHVKDLLQPCWLLLTR